MPLTGTPIFSHATPFGLRTAVLGFETHFMDTLSYTAGMRPTHRVPPGFGSRDRRLPLLFIFRGRAVACRLQTPGGSVDFRSFDILKGAKNNVPRWGSSLGSLSGRGTRCTCSRQARRCWLAEPRATPPRLRSAAPSPELPT